MSEKLIQTSKGTVHLRTISSSMYESASERWPLRFLRVKSPENEALTGIVFRQGEKELSGLKFQQVDHADKDARLWTLLNSAALAMSSKAYQSACFGGILLAGVYLRQKGAGRSECGFAIFPIPDALGAEARRPAELAHIDEQLGRGSTTMAMTIINSAMAIGKTWGLPQLIDIDLRTRSGFGGLQLDLLYVGTDVVVLRRTLSEGDPFWKALAQSGTREFYHMPSVPVTVAD